MFKVIKGMKIFINKFKQICNFFLILHKSYLKRLCLEMSSKLAFDLVKHAILNQTTMSLRIKTADAYLNDENIISEN